MTAGTRKSFPAFRMKMCGPFDIRPVSLTAEAIKRCSSDMPRHQNRLVFARRIADFGMAPAWNRHAADHGASNLLLWSSGSLVLRLVLRRCAGRRHCERKEGSRNNRYDCFHCGCSLRSFSRSRFSAREASFRHCCATIKSSRRSDGGICWARSSHFSALA